MVYPVELSYSHVGECTEFPWIRPSNLLKAMSDTGDLRLLLGGSPTIAAAQQALESFWAKFQMLFPSHGVFKKIKDSAGTIKPCQLLPLLVHGDEGTTYKRNGVLIIQFAGVIGHGSRHNRADDEWYKHLEDSGIPMNLLTNAMQTRFLSVICPKDLGSLVQRHGVATIFQSKFSRC